MINVINVYAIGLSVLSLYVLKKYIEVQRVWKLYR